MVNVPFMKATATALAVALLVSGCAAPQGGQGGQVGQGSRNTSTANQQVTNDNPCNAVGGAIAGALAGALLAKAAGKKAGRGAAIGAAAGAALCLTINAQSRQTRTAEAVERDYQQSRGALPAAPAVTAYQVQFYPTQNQTIRASDTIKTVSRVEVVRGQSTPITELKEHITVYDLENRKISSGSKSLMESQPGSGGFENTFNVNLPKDAPQGVYTVESELSLNGRTVPGSTTRSRVQIASLADGISVIVAMH
jgi:uncharacterized protein YcfJ